MKNKMQKGITLIALVVTIVVLLILAGVTISMLTGENGIINQSQNAKEESLKFELEELVDLTLMEYKTDKESGKDTDLGELLYSKEGKYFENVTEDEENYIVEKNGYEVKVSKDGIRITDAEKVRGVIPKLEVGKSYNEESDNVIITVTINNYDEIEIVDSFVLYDFGGDPIPETTNEDNKTKTFEVEKNGKYKAVVTATTGEITRTGTKSIVVDEFETFSDIYTSTKQYTDSEGNTAWIPQGFAVGVSDNINKISTGLVITDQIDEGHNGIGNQFVWVPVGNYKVRSETKTNNLTRRQWGTIVNETVIPTELSGDELINGYSGKYYQGESTSIVEFLKQAELKKGFYIGRYEQGEGNVVKKNVPVKSNVTRDQAEKLANSLYNSIDESVESELINSYAWDTALNYICQTNIVGYNLATTNNMDYANIATNVLKKTGEYSIDKYSNIYDILGNVREWTTEKSSYTANSCVGRGGVYKNSDGFAGYRVYAGTSSMSLALGFRSILYVK